MREVCYGKVAYPSHHVCTCSLAEAVTGLCVVDEAGSEAVFLSSLSSAYHCLDCIRIVLINTRWSFRTWYIHKGKWLPSESSPHPAERAVGAFYLVWPWWRRCLVFLKLAHWNSGHCYNGLRWFFAARRSKAIEDESFTTLPLQAASTLLSSSCIAYWTWYTSVASMLKEVIPFCRSATSRQKQNIFQCSTNDSDSVCTIAR